MRTIQSWTCELGYGADTMFHRTYFWFATSLLPLGSLDLTFFSWVFSSADLAVRPGKVELRSFVVRFVYSHHQFFLLFDEKVVASMFF